jgi:hypothetical protein
VKPQGQLPLPEEEYDRLLAMVEREIEAEEEAERAAA